VPQDKQITHVVLMAGPYSGTYAADEMKPYESRASLRIPVDEHFIVTSGKPFAVAVYQITNIPSENVRTFWFKKFVKADDGPFLVELVGGPLAGTRLLAQPVLGLPQLVMLPVRSELQTDAKGRQRVFAIYKNGAFFGGEHKLIFQSEMRDLVATPHIIFELTGGPFDGVTYDTDAGMLDQISEFRARGLYSVTRQGQIGKRFMQVADHAWTTLDELGDEIADKLGPFPNHKYEVCEKIEYPLEIYVRAKYVGIAPDD
jgi:hypothetical protein